MSDCTPVRTVGDKVFVVPESWASEMQTDDPVWVFVNQVNSAWKIAIVTLCS